MDASVVEGIILNADLPDDLSILVLVFGVLQDGGIGANTLGRGERLTVLSGVGGLGRNYAPEVVLFMGLVWQPDCINKGVSSYRIRIISSWEVFSVIGTKDSLASVSWSASSFVYMARLVRQWWCWQRWWRWRCY